MATDRKPFLLRVDKEIMNALQRWADDDLRSLNGQIDFILRKALKDSGRMPKTTSFQRDSSYSETPAPEQKG